MTTKLKKINFNLKNKNIIITGGSGFLGAQLINSFLNQKSIVYNIDIITPKRKNKSIFIKSDITNENSLNEVLNFFKKKK